VFCFFYVITRRTKVADFSQREGTEFPRPLKPLLLIGGFASPLLLTFGKVTWFPHPNKQTRFTFSIKRVENKMQSMRAILPIEGFRPEYLRFEKSFKEMGIEPSASQMDLGPAKCFHISYSNELCSVNPLLISIEFGLEQVADKESIVAGTIDRILSAFRDWRIRSSEGSPPLPTSLAKMRNQNPPFGGASAKTELSRSTCEILDKNEKIVLETRYVWEYVTEDHDQIGLECTVSPWVL
jgi:hypothetical protein